MGLWSFRLVMTCIVAVELSALVMGLSWSQHDDSCKYSTCSIKISPSETDAEISNQGKIQYQAYGLASRDTNWQHLSRKDLSQDIQCEKIPHRTVPEFSETKIKYLTYDRMANQNIVEQKYDKVQLERVERTAHIVMKCSVLGNQYGPKICFRDEIQDLLLPYKIRISTVSLTPRNSTARKADVLVYDRQQYTSNLIKKPRTSRPASLRAAGTFTYNPDRCDIDKSFGSPPPIQQSDLSESQRSKLCSAAAAARNLYGTREDSPVIFRPLRF